MTDFYVHLPSNVGDNTGNNSLNDFNTNFTECISLDSEYEVGVSDISFSKSWYNVSDDMARNSRILLISAKKVAFEYAVTDFTRVDDFVRTNLINDLLPVKFSPYEFESYDRRPYKTLSSIMEESRGAYICDAVHPGHYESIDALVSELNSRIRTEVNRTVDEPQLAELIAPRFEVDHLGQHLRLFSGFHVNDGKARVCFVHITGPLGDMLGMPQSHKDSQAFITTSLYTVTAKRLEPGKDQADSGKEQASLDKEQEVPWYALQYHGCYDMTCSIRCLLVYTDLVKPIRVGNSYERLIRIVEIPNNVGYGSQVVLSYPLIQYVPVAGTYLTSAQISIKDDMGEPIPFKFGRTIVTLHFRKRLLT